MLAQRQRLENWIKSLKNQFADFLGETIFMSLAKFMMHLSNLHPP